MSCSSTDIIQEDSGNVDEGCGIPAPNMMATWVHSTPAAAEVPWIPSMQVVVSFFVLPGQLAGSVHCTLHVPVTGMFYCGPLLGDNSVFPSGWSIAMLLVYLT